MAKDKPKGGKAAKKAAEPKPTGRPSKYTVELGELICSLLAEGQSLRKICELEIMPRRSTVLLWVIKGWNGDEKYKDFSGTYARAREAQAESHFDDMVDIADDDRNDYGFKESEDNSGKGASACIMPDNIQRSKLRLDTRKWIATRILQSKYGDKSHVKLTDADDKPLTFTINIGDAGSEAD
jgi:hypothetical protein